MKTLITALIITCFSFIPVTAQSTYSAYWRVAPSSPSSGNGTQLGVGADVLYDSGSFLLVDIDASLVKENKLYVGDGTSFRSQGELLAKITKKVYAGGGLAAGVHWNSQYTKAQYQPMASIHYRPSIEMDFYGTILFPAWGNDNDVVGYRGGYRAIIPTSSDKKWGIFAQIEYTQFSFTSGGKRYNSGSAMFGVGLSKIQK